MPWLETGLGRIRCLAGAQLFLIMRGQQEILLCWGGWQCYLPHLLPAYLTSSHPDLDQNSIVNPWQDSVWKWLHGLEQQLVRLQPCGDGDPQGVDRGRGGGYQVTIGRAGGGDQAFLLGCLLWLYARTATSSSCRAQVRLVSLILSSLTPLILFLSNLSLPSFYPSSHSLWITNIVNFV